MRLKQTLQLGLFLLCTTLTAPLAKAGGGMDGGGGGTFVSVFKEGMIAALATIEQTEKIGDLGIADSAATAFYTEHRAAWINVLRKLITDPNGVNPVEIWLEDEGKRVAAYARFDHSKMRIDLSLPFIQPSGLSPEQAFVLAVHEVGHLVTSRSALKNHGDLDQIGLDLLEHKKRSSVRARLLSGEKVRLYSSVQNNSCDRDLEYDSGTKRLTVFPLTSMHGIPDKCGWNETEDFECDASLNQCRLTEFPPGAGTRIDLTYTIRQASVSLESDARRKTCSESECPALFSFQSDFSIDPPARD